MDRYLKEHLTTIIENKGACLEAREFSEGHVWCKVFDGSGGDIQCPVSENLTNSSDCPFHLALRVARSTLMECE